MADLFGMKIIASEFVKPVPAFTINPDVPLSDSFRAEMQQWCNDFFGMREVLYVVDQRMFGLIPGLGHSPILVMNPKHAAMLTNIRA